MNGYDIYKKAVTRLGYNSCDDKALLEKAGELIGQISADLKLEQITDLTADLQLDSNEAEAVCCGVTMLLALIEGDGEKHRIFCELYNAKRASLLSECNVKKDCLPVAESGVL